VIESIIKSRTQAEQVLNGFDPENNVQDRRILYEVTGMRIFGQEFRD